MKTLFGLCLVLFATPSCTLIAMAFGAECLDYYRDERYAGYNYTSYTIRANEKTHDGIRVDRSGFEIDFDRIDQLTLELEACLQQSIKRCGFRVKIAPDSKYHACSQRELFPCRDPNFRPGCLEEACPCGCTGVNQYPSTVVVTPNLAAYKHELIHTVTHRDHGDPVFNCERQSASAQTLMCEAPDANWCVGD